MMQRLRQWLQSNAALRFIQHQYVRQHDSLLTTADIEAIEHRIYSINKQTLFKHRNSQYPQYGEDPSVKLGSGYDFADNRLFQSGDERRHINWRQYARSQVLHLKQFHEELNPSLMIVVDKRSPMYFGSRIRLKVQQAATVALALVFYARKLGYDTGLLILGDRLEWHKPAPLAQNIDKLVAIINSSHDPGTTNNISLDSALNLLNDRMATGSQLYLISDFHDLNDSNSGQLWSLYQQHNINAVYISDELESHIPDAGKINFQAQDGVIAIDSHNKIIRAQYEQLMQQHRQQLRQLLQLSSAFYEIKTHEDAIKLLLGGADAI